MRIEFRSKQHLNAINVDIMAKIGAILRYAAKEEQVPASYMVTLGFTDDTTIRRFNHRFRNIDRATDVLSFPMTAGRAEWSSAPALLPEGMAPMSLGEILISVDHCMAQADVYGHSFEREICFLALHGFLHLLGYDHMEAAERREMEAVADRYLTALGVTR